MARSACSSVMQPYMSSPVFVLLLTRLQGSKTDKFSQGLLKFIAFAAAIQKNDLTPDQVIGFVDGVQPGCVAFEAFAVGPSTDRLFATIVFSARCCRSSCPRCRRCP